MKVLHINTSLGHGGAANLMIILSEKLTQDYNIENFHIVSYSSEKSNDNNVEIIEDNKYLFGQKKFKRILTENGFMDVFLPSHKKSIIKKIKEIKPDIIHLHNIHGGYFQLNLLERLSKFAPVVWTFHDMFPFTGHCAYSFDCEKWRNGCGNCPMLDIYPAISKDRTKFLWKYKEKVYKKSRFTIVAPSKWLFDCIKKGMLRDRDVRLIYNGIDTEIFKKIDKNEARKKLSLPHDKKIILFSANGGITNPFKGGEYVLKVYKKFKSRDVLFLNVGHKDEQQNLANWKNYGYVADKKEMALLYSASDIYLFPTLAEVFGLVVAEAMLCKLPVVTFDTGGVPELVEHLKTGYVAEYKNTESLFRGVDMLLSDNKIRQELGFAGEKRVTEAFDVKIMVKKYYDLYCEIIAETK